MKRKDLYTACVWDDVAVKRDAPHFPFCSERCKRASEADVPSTPIDGQQPTEAPDIACPEASSLVPYEERVEFELLERLTNPDSLSEWGEVFFMRPWRERRYK
jgi:hypothetical protein